MTDEGVDRVFGHGQGQGREGVNIPGAEGEDVDCFPEGVQRRMERKEEIHLPGQVREGIRDREEFGLEGVVL